MIDYFSDLEASQNRLLDHLHTLPEQDCYQQYLDDLSPVAWHIGHCAFIEEYWIREVILGDNSVTESLKNLYFPELSPKQFRAKLLPPHQPLIEFASELFSQHLDLLTELAETHNPHKLLNENYLIRFLLQHNHQHQETVDQVLYQRALQMDWEYEAQTILVASHYDAQSSEFETCESNFGNNVIAEAYDNERPVFRTSLAAFKIGQRSVSNSEYLGFMESNGYRTQTYWSPEGWQWLQKSNVLCPAHWRRDKNDNWFAIVQDGPEVLQPGDAVYGLNRYEAEAFANFAGGRLPHELEWEHAVKPQSSPAKQAWDWCRNTFFPYPNYTAYPYDGYSQPWFDGNHFALRGASRHTGVPMRRNSFRNFYTPEKRHVFAGVRVAFDL